MTVRSPRKPTRAERPAPRTPTATPTKARATRASGPAAATAWKAQPTKATGWTPQALPAPATVQSLYDTVRARHGRNTAPGRLLDKLVTSPGFARLPEAEQLRMLRVMGGNSELVSKPARQQLERVVNSQGFGKADAAGQAAQLKAVLDAESWLPSVMSAISPPSPPQRQAWTDVRSTPVEAYQFEAIRMGAVQHDIRVGDRTIPVMMPNPPVRGTPTLEQVANGLAALPASSLRAVAKVDVEPTRNPGDAHWAAVYGKPEFRSYMTAGASGTINVFPSGAHRQDTLDASFIHETGHVISQRAWGASSDARGWQRWRQAAASDGVRTSAYARNNVAEDFCETLVAYQRAKGTPAEAEYRALMPAKFALLDEMTR